MFPKIGGKPPKWMVKIMENPIKMDDLGGKTTPIFGNTHLINPLRRDPLFPKVGSGGIGAVAP